ncbi:MAG: GTP-binding protein, partial [Myxococcales bacterium]|nr:GTP-binding protein [Myxococcales bacterium]
AEAIAQALVTHPAPLGGTLFIERGEAPDLDLGEAKRVVVTAVSERSELSIKDRDVFAAADAVVLNKIDLVSTLGFDAVALERNVRSVNPTARVFQVSGRTGAGLDAWVSWLEESRTREFTAMASPV